jgi:hypothetical protein
MILAIVIWLSPYGGYACGAPMPLDQATAWIAAHPGEILVRSDDPTYAAQLALCPPIFKLIECGGWCGTPCSFQTITDYSTEPPTKRVIGIYNCNPGMPNGQAGAG